MSVASAAPVMTWVLASRMLRQRLATAELFADDPIAAWRRANARVPLAFLYGSIATLVAGFALVGTAGPDASGFASVVAMLATLGALFVGVPAWLTLSILASRGKGPRYVAEPQPPFPARPPVLVKGRPEPINRWVTWVGFVVFLPISAGVASGIHSPWAGLMALTGLPMGLIAARTGQQRVEVLSDRVIMSGMLCEYVWTADAADAVHVAPILTVRDRSGAAFVGMYSRIKDVAIDADACALPLTRERPYDSWRPGVAPGYVRRRLAVSGAEITVWVVTASVAILIGALASSS